MHTHRQRQRDSETETETEAEKRDGELTKYVQIEIVTTIVKHLKE